MQSTNTRSNHLIEGDINWLTEISKPLPVSYSFCSELLKKLIDRYEFSVEASADYFSNSNWVSGRLVELLPFDLAIKQTLLEMDDAIERLDCIQKLLHKWSIDKSAMEV